MEPSREGPYRGTRVKPNPPPVYLEFMRVLTPHFQWIAANLQCTPWLVVKRMDLWLSRVFDAADHPIGSNYACVFARSAGNDVKNMEIVPPHHDLPDFYGGRCYGG